MKNLLDKNNEERVKKIYKPSIVEYLVPLGGLWYFARTSLFDDRLSKNERKENSWRRRNYLEPFMILEGFKISGTILYLAIKNG